MMRALATPIGGGLEKRVSGCGSEGSRQKAGFLSPRRPDPFTVREHAACWPDMKLVPRPERTDLDLVAVLVAAVAVAFVLILLFGCSGAP